MNGFRRLHVSFAFLLALGLVGCSGGDSEKTEPQSAGGEAMTAGPASPPAGGHGGSAEITSLPVYEVTGWGIDSEQAARLAAALHIDATTWAWAKFPAGDDGAVHFLDAARFQRLPTKTAPTVLPATQDEKAGKPSRPIKRLISRL